MKNYETGIQKLIREKQQMKDKKEQKEATMEAQAMVAAMKAKGKK